MKAHKKNHEDPTKPSDYWNRNASSIKIDHDTNDAKNQKNVLFISNISYSCTVNEIENLFKAYCESKDFHVRLQMKTGERNTGRGRVYFYSKDAATKVMDKLNGSKFHGRNLRIKKNY